MTFTVTTSGLLGGGHFCIQKFITIQVSPLIVWYDLLSRDMFFGYIIAQSNSTIFRLNEMNM